MACSSETDDTESDRQIGLHSLRNADLCLEKGTYGRAFAHYLMVLKLLPSRKPGTNVYVLIVAICRILVYHFSVFLGRNLF